ncbi:MAG: phosphatase PAP2 family protein [Betaproteobacteria bacterium]|nr:phosphatase PAP2 family protein [Betaproteobacteria bacterium]
MTSIRRAAFACIAILCSGSALAAGGPLGIDHTMTYDNDGIIQRKVQLAVEDLTLATIVAGALWEGGDNRLGKTYWKALDASGLGAVSSTVLKQTFTRSRPMQSSNPDLWFQGKGHYSFPSGEVTFVTAAITPFVLEYGHDHPGVYALEALPLYDAIARLKVAGHWQTDVLAGFALGTAAGYLAHREDSPFILHALPGGFEVGIRKRF